MEVIVTPALEAPILSDQTDVQAVALRAQSHGSTCSKCTFRVHLGQSASISGLDRAPMYTLKTALDSEASRKWASGQCHPVVSQNRQGSVPS